MPFAIFALAAINIAIGTQSFVFAGLLTELARDLGVSIGAAGLLVPATSITFAAPSPLATSLVSGFGRKRVMVIGLLALALCNALCAGAFLRLAVRTSYPWRGSDGVCRLAPQRRCDRAGATGERRGRAFAIVLGGLTVALGRAAGIGGGRPFGMARHVRLLGETWLAVTSDGSLIPPATAVIVTNVVGTTLTVRAAVEDWELT